MARHPQNPVQNYQKYIIFLIMGLATACFAVGLCWLSSPFGALAAFGPGLALLYLAIWCCKYTGDLEKNPLGTIAPLVGRREKK